MTLHESALEAAARAVHEEECCSDWDSTLGVYERNRYRALSRAAVDAYQNALTATAPEEAVRARVEPVWNAYCSDCACGALFAAPSPAAVTAAVADWIGKA